MNRPTWDSFIAVNSGDKQTAFESLARMLFKAKYNLEDNKIGFVSPERRYEAPTVARPPQM